VRHAVRVDVAPRLLALMAALALSVPRAARADPPPVTIAAMAATTPPAPPPAALPRVTAPRAWHVDVSAGTQFPVAVGLMTQTELPYRLLFQLDLGWMPTPYAYLVDDFLQAVGAYDDTVATIVRAALTNSFVLRTGAGWRPFSGHGFEVTGGYTLVALGGALGDAAVIDALLQEKGSTARVPTGSGTQIGLHATLQSVHVAAGWRWLFLDDRLVLRASLSYLQCLAANVSADLGTSRAAVAVNQQLQGYLAPYFTTYVKAPLAGLSFGYRF